MRILVLSWKDMAHPAAGGAEVYTAHITREWALAGHEVTWFCAAVRGQPAEQVVEGVRIVRGGSRFSVFAAARRWYLRQGMGRFDVIVDEVNTRPFLSPRWAGGTPVVALIFQVCKEIWSFEMPAPVALLGRYVLEPHWLRLYRDVPTLTISESSRASLADYGLRRIEIVPVGVPDLKRPDVQRETRPTVLFVGRVSDNKRPGDAVEAFRLLREQLSEARMWVVGDGPQRAHLQAAAPEGVTFLGRVDEDTKHELMARAHVLVVTSVREGWGLVVDEAAAMGTPSIGYDVPGLRDSVVTARGVLVPPTPAALAASLRERLPTWVREPADDGWEGGGVGWPAVASIVLDHLRHAARTGDFRQCA